MNSDRKDRCKSKAAELADIFIEDGSKGAFAYKTMYDSGAFSNNECLMIIKLCDLYIAIKQGVTSKADGIRQQKQILDEFEGID